MAIKMQMRMVIVDGVSNGDGNCDGDGNSDEIWDEDEDEMRMRIWDALY